MTKEIDDLKRRIETFIKYTVYRILKITSADILYDFGKYIIVNINRAKDKEPFEEYNNKKIPIGYNLIINEILRRSYALDSVNQTLEEFELWVYESTVPNNKN